MPKSLHHNQSVLDIALLCIGIAALFTTAFQYPLSTTFPMGGDAAPHIATVRDVFTDPIETIFRISHSWYPVSYILFSINALNPFVYWPVAFSWWMALGQIATGLALGFLVYRLYGIRASAISTAIWAMTPITMTSFFEDGTMAQLWSLPWLLLFIERMHAKSIRGMILFSILALFSHPITALIMICVMVMSLPHIPRGILKKILVWSTAVGVGIATLFLSIRSSTIRTPFTPEASKYFTDLFHGFFLPWVLASVIGWIELTKTIKKNTLLLTTLVSFFVTSFAFACNDRLGIGFWTNRLNAYILLCVALGAGIGLALITRKIVLERMALLIIILLIIAFTGSTFHDNINIYKRYESSHTDARIRPDNLAAISWLNEHLPKDAVLASTAVTRYYEWLPVLTYHKQYIIKSIENIGSYSGMKNPYLVIFTNEEGVPDSILNNTTNFHLKFKNTGSQIYEVTL
ncbi:MAG: hypothetical protein ABIP54_01900 [Candidatus Andersenbacteria bacterium]